MDKIQHVTDMPVYQAFCELATEVEGMTRQLGPDFRWLRVQSLRSSESVCANMAEGFYSQYSTEYLQSLYRCRREARETMVHLQYTANTGQFTQTAINGLLSGYEEALTQLTLLIGSIERKITERGKGKPSACVREEPVGYKTADLGPVESDCLDCLPIDH